MDNSFTDLFNEPLKVKKVKAEPPVNWWQKPKLDLSEVNLSSFTHEIKPQYVGQILYIKPTMIVSVPVFDTVRNYKTSARIANESNLKNNKHESKLSVKAISRIKTAINWLVVSAKEKSVYSNTSKKTFNFKVNLITLTLPDTAIKIKESDFKKKLIHPFLVYMKKYYNLRNYVWKVEFQNNGKLHLHITTDTFVSHHVLRFYWNSLLKKNGYLVDFIKKHKHDNPNSTDVHAVWKVKNLGAYIAKYMAKNEDSKEIVNGRIWGCNYELSDKQKCIVDINRDDCAMELRQLMNPIIKYKEIINEDKVTGKIYKNAEIFFIELGYWSTIISGQIRKAFDQRRFNIRNHAQTPSSMFVID